MQTATTGWGPAGIEEALANHDLIVVVDVLRFSSTVTTAVANGFTIVPSTDLKKAELLSGETGWAVSGRTGTAQYSLSPLDYVNPKHTDEVILVSPNGAACMQMISEEETGFIGCFLNARTVGRVLNTLSQKRRRNVAVIAAGEVKEGQSEDLHQRRFALEDYLGCGLILSELRLALSPEATLCMRAYEASKMDYVELVRNCESGRYLIERGQDYDISHCVQRSIYEIVPVIHDAMIVRFDELR
jgi:2-phosphosulfolactate phosphatase